MGSINVNDLPDDIILLIIGQLCRSSYCKISIWKSELTLLSICKRWRKLAFPLVYRRVYIEYGNNKLGIAQFSSNNEALTEEPVNLELATNSILAINAGVVAQVKCIQIEINYILHPLTGLKAVLDAIQENAHQWPSVCEINIFFERHEEVDATINNISMHAGNIIQRISTIVQLVHKLLPNLVAFNFSSSSENSVELHLCNSLLAAHSQCVTKLISSCPLRVQRLHFFEKLTYMDIAVDDGVNFTQHAPYFTESLIYLNLRNIPPWFNWSVFTDKSSTSTIKFSNLQKLGLKFIPSGFFTEARLRHSKNKKIIKIKFPMLKILDILCYIGYQPMFDSLVFPDRIRLLQINSDANFLCFTNHTNVPLADKVLMHISDNDIHVNGNIFKTIDQIACKIKVYGQIELTIYRADTLELINKTKYSGITMLGVYITAESDKLVEAIMHLPTLTEITFLNVVVTKEESQRYAAINDASKLEHVEPFNSCLKKLVLGWNEYEDPSAEFIILLKYLLPCLPALKDLVLLNGPHKLVFEAVYELGLKHFHLRNIKVS